MPKQAKLDCCLGMHSSGRETTEKCREIMLQRLVSWLPLRGGEQDREGDTDNFQRFDNASSHCTLMLCSLFHLYVLFHNKNVK